MSRGMINPRKRRRRLCKHGLVFYCLIVKMSQKQRMAVGLLFLRNHMFYVAVLYIVENLVGHVVPGEHLRHRVHRKL